MLVMAFFYWKIGVFQQIVVRVYCILNYYHRSPSQVKYKILLTDSFGKFTKQLSLLWQRDRIVNFQNSFVSRIFSKHTMLFRHWHGVHMTSRGHIKLVSASCFYCDNSYYLRNCSTYNSPLCLRSNNIKSVFDSVIIVVSMTPYLFIFRSISGRNLQFCFDFKSVISS